MTTSWKSFIVHAKGTSATISFITGGTSISTALAVSLLRHKDRDGLVNFLHAVEKAHGPLPVLTFPRLDFFRIVRSFPVFSQLGRSEAHAQLSPLPCSKIAVIAIDEGLGRASPPRSAKNRCHTKPLASRQFPPSGTQ